MNIQSATTSKSDEGILATTFSINTRSNEESTGITDKGERKIDLLNPESVSKTEIAKININHSFKDFYRPRAVIQTNIAQQNFVNGAIRSIDDVSVKCLLNIPDANEVEVEFPRSLFPEDISFGDSFKLEMIEDNGIRKPKISSRESNSEATRQIREQLEAIIKEL